MIFIVVGCILSLPGWAKATHVVLKDGPFRIPVEKVILQGSPQQEIGTAATILKCDRPQKARFTLENPTSNPIEVFLAENWVTTMSTNIATTSTKGPIDISTKSITNQHHNLISLVQFASWEVPPGSHNVEVQHQCITTGKYSLILMDLKTFQSYSFKLTALKIVLLVAMFVFALYAIVVGAFIRTKEFLIYGIIVVSSGFVIAHYLFNNDPNFILPEVWGLKNREYQLSFIAQGIALILFLRSKAQSRGYRTSVLTPIIYLSYIAIPFLITVPVAQGLLIFFAVSSPATIVMLLFSIRCKLYAEVIAQFFYVVGNILGFVHLFFESVPFDLYWASPAGMVLFNFILLNGFIYDAHRSYLRKKANMRRRNDHELNLQLATALQEKFMSSDGRDHITSYYRPAEKIGGDWFQYFYSNDGSLLHIFIGDVTDHGVKSAYMTALVAGGMKEIKRKFSRLSGISTEELQYAADYFNDLFYREGSRYSLSMTFIGATIDLGSREMALMNISHNHPMLVKENSLKPMHVKGPYLAMSKKIKATIKMFSIPAGDQVFFYTDGLLENGPRDRLIKLRDLKTILNQNASPIENEEALIKLMNERWNEYIKDDVTFLIFKMPQKEQSSAA